jgi:hypothetical protein
VEAGLAAELWQRAADLPGRVASLALDPSHARGGFESALLAALPRALAARAAEPLAWSPFDPGRQLEAWSQPAPPSASQPEEAREAPRRGRAPAGAIEPVLVAIWEELFGIRDLAVDDDFFRLGGHSLLASQVAARVRQQLGVPITVRAIFEAPTIEGLARRVAETGSAGSAAEEPAWAGAGAGTESVVLDGRVVALAELSDADVDELLDQLVREPPP